MCGPISGSAYSNKGIVSQCCCGCTLRTGSLIIGWFELITSVLWIINIAAGRHGGASYIQVINIVICLFAAILILFGTYKQNAKAFWISVYLELVLAIWMLVFSIIYFVALLWAVGGAGILSFIIYTYFFVVLRSYGYEMDAGRGAAFSPA